MKIVIPGGSGQAGTVLARAFHRDGHLGVVLSRRPQSRPWRVVVKVALRSAMTLSPDRYGVSTCWRGSRAAAWEVLESGFAFRFPLWRDAASDLCGRRIAGQPRLAR